MKTAKLIELERQRLDLIEEARAALRAIDNNTDAKRAKELEARHDAAMRAIDANALDIDQAKLEAETEEHRAAARPEMGGTAAAGVDGPGAFLSGRRADWVDARGNPVRVLSRADQFSQRSYTGPSVGDLIAAKISGPRNEAEERALSASTNSAGGFTVPEPLAQDFIDLMRRNSSAISAGAITVPMESETLAIARATGDPSVAWRAENAAVSETDPTYDRVTFTAKTLAGGVKMSRELAADSLNIGALVQQQLAAKMALELDRAAIWGDGSGASPTGVTNTSGINTVSMGTNGAAIADYDKLLDAIYELTLDDVPGPYAGIMHPRTQLAIQKLKDSQNNPLTQPEWIRNTPPFVTTAAPIDETEGTADNASSIVFGNFSHLMIGLRQSVEIRIFDQTYAATGQLYVQAWMRADVQLSQPKAFSVLTGVIPA
ncbi:phage major capsid protein [Erythrobacter aurantius]|uniref:phage major capsid protein n=1 Tax=Erythrobacter aurantius TaxID=2909249 RepID=UPI00207A27B8|nr:phage major capsid protein [Erythrobacter aurantius]